MAPDDKRGPIMPVRGSGPPAIEESGPERTAPPTSADRHTGTSAQSSPDRFRPAGRLEAFVRAIAERVEHGWLYQTFRLPGSNRVIHDRRGERAEKKETDAGRRTTDDGRKTAKEAGRQETGPALRLQGGRLQPATPRVHPNFLGERTSGQPPAAGGRTAEDRPLSVFEERLVGRFEAGEEQAAPTPDGRPHFLQKTAAQWKEFFLRFLHRTEKKSVPMDAVAEALTFRGLFRKGSDPATGVVVGDLSLATGVVEKFARFDVRLAPIQSAIAQLAAGAPLPKATVAQGIEGETLDYLAIAPPSATAAGDGALAGVARDAQGVFTSLKTEAEIARQLGFGPPTTEAAASSSAGGVMAGEERVARHRRGWGWSFGESDSPPDEAAGHFVPWWQLWNREERLGQRRWFTAVTLAFILALLALGVWAIVRALAS